jgi:AraC family transcriptional activator of tynA and feaB
MKRAKHSTPRATRVRARARLAGARHCCNVRESGDLNTDESLKKTSAGTVRREQIHSYIELHLHDPSLTPSSVAAAVHLSSRRIHQLFEADAETVGAYILRRRLEECARAMADVSQCSRTITEIAFLHGFNNASHFGRVFRERYNSTPRDYRRRSAAA